MVHGRRIGVRSDKRKDRVEIAPEQLSEGMEWVAGVAAKTGRPVRIVGWCGCLGE
jgi:hypothetical protein